MWHGFASLVFVANELHKAHCPFSCDTLNKGEIHASELININILVILVAVQNEQIGNAQFSIELKSIERNEFDDRNASINASDQTTKWLIQMNWSEHKTQINRYAYR